ncbi:LysR family transcriptional regulator [Paraburkholderia fungorum]|uniref:DNA-binding transcriptional LysR family regulator n=1 Tax=Paraburkholderia fungorum TaxID=134537 RepID=A0AAW3V961_9BURK|nr:LysR family transcriptional regulator [Paraburkholderia fungorum]MBB4517901.1 DNA-binding transcriptional LysR family regulator [Paraburkholderia fungorum]MBB6205870.1 DNA-binding transcriptional LysR family regulator [Paraburkholderia fungorum]
MLPAIPDLRQLRYFVTVAEEKHFGRAAVRLSMTQPPLSQAIRALEETLGVELFARTKRSVELTPVGADLLPEVQRLLAGAEGLRPLAQSLARGEAGVLSLAFVSTADYGLLPLLLRDFGARHPRVRLELTEATSDVQVDELVAGRIDAGLVIAPLPSRHATQLSWLSIAREPLVIAMSTETAARVSAAAESDTRPHADPCAEWLDTPISLRDVADEPLVIFPRRLAPGFYDIIMDCYGVAGLAPRVGQEAIQMQTIVSLVSAGMGVALVPQSLRNLRRTGVVYRPLAESVPAIETGLVWRTAEVSPVLAGFIEIVRAHAATVEAQFAAPRT